MEKNMRNPNDPNQLSSVATTGKVRMMPPVQDKLINHFENADMQYTHEELKNKLYSYQQYYVSADEKLKLVLGNIYSILSDTDNFLNGTTLEEFFKQVRDESKNENELKEILDDIDKALLNAQEKLKSKDLNPVFKATYEKAIKYCKNCIVERIKCLKNANDKIYSLYQNHHLKNIFEPKSFVPKK